MSWDYSLAPEEVSEVFVAEEEVESSEEPPKEEWSSYIPPEPEVCYKKVLQAQGLYDPGSAEICAKYIAQSNSTILSHDYFNYPSVSDPGILNALLDSEPEVLYPLDGQELYLHLCKELNLCPVRKFQRGLLKDVIDLRYYCVDPKGVYAMARALKYNQTVKVLNLTDNFLTADACYHLGDMLTTNASLTELNLSGCRIGTEGTKKLLLNLHVNRKLKTLNLNGNQISGAGVICLANSMIKGMDIKELYLSNNDLGSGAADALIEGLETHNDFVVLDLSWNNLFNPVPMSNLLNKLSESSWLENLDLSWNALSGKRFATAIKNLITTPSLKFLNLSNNKLIGEDIAIIISNFTKAKTLVTIDFSNNPLTPGDAYSILHKMRFVSVKLQNLIMRNVFVNEEFLNLLKQVKGLRYRKNFTCDYGGVIPTFLPTEPDPRELILNRINYMTIKSKTNKVDIALLVLQLLKEDKCLIEIRDFVNIIRRFQARLDEDLINELVDAFPGPRTAKTKTIDIVLLADFVVRKWPDRKLPPTPPPEEPEPEPEQPTKQTKAKKNKKGKKK